MCGVRGSRTSRAHPEHQVRGVKLTPSLGKMPPRQQRSRGWCFTLNNYVIEDCDLLDQVECQYVIYGKETAPTTGTPHLQGYIHFANEKTLRSVKAILGSRYHLEARQGTIEQAIEYCKKEGNWKERGHVQRRQTQKDQWGDAIELAEAGDLQTLKETYPRLYLTYFKTLMSIRAFNSKPLEGELQHEWWYGPTGTGKSKTAWERYPNHYQKPVNKWWDGYFGQDVVVIEEWEPKNECTASKLKIWADRYPFPGEIKGGTLERIRPKKIIVTSNYTIRECFPNPQDHEPLLRRFKVVHFPYPCASSTEAAPVEPRSPLTFGDELDAINTLLNLSQ